MKLRSGGSDLSSSSIHDSRISVCPPGNAALSYCNVRQRSVRNKCESTKAFSFEDDRGVATCVPMSSSLD